MQKNSLMIGLKSRVDTLCPGIVTVDGDSVVAVAKSTVTISSVVISEVATSEVGGSFVVGKKVLRSSVLTGVSVVATQEPLWSSLRFLSRQIAFVNSQLEKKQRVI